MKKRNPALVVVFSIITCGIYMLYWYVSVTNEIESEVKEKGKACRSGGLALLFMIITCGIYNFYWVYQECKRLASIERDKGMSGTDNSLVCLILSVLGLGIISTILMQCQMNNIAETPDQKEPVAEETNTVSENSVPDAE